MARRVDPVGGDLAAKVTAMGQVALLDAQQWEARWLPRWPLASDDLAMGSYRMRRDRALGMTYLEHSPSALQTMLVVDVDHHDTLLRALSRPLTHPEPSWVAEGVNGRGHVGWLLQTPVCRTDAGRDAPLRFAAKVELGLTRAMDGDPGYAGVLTKNPTHDRWTTTWCRAQPWELRDLAGALGELMPRSLPRQGAESSGLGRNVTLFNDLRLWSYPRRRHYDRQLDWEGVVEAMALAHNDRFATPLDFTEVRATARSVARWTWRNLSEDGFRAKQAARGRASAAARGLSGQRKAAAAGVLAGNPSKAGKIGGKIGGRANTPAQRAARLRNLPMTKVDRAAALEVLT
jgi:hypothetical protein